MTPEGFTQLGKLVPSPLLLLDAEGMVVRASSPAGMPPLWPDRVVERRLSDLVANPVDEVDHFVAACRRTGQPLIGSLTFRGSVTDAEGEGTQCRCYGAAAVEAGGRSRFVMLRVVPRRAGGGLDRFAELNERLELLQNLHRDRSEAAQEFAKRERHLAGLIETTQDAVIFIDGEHNITRANLAAKRMFGYADDEVVGRPVAMLMAEPHRSKHDEYIARYERTKEARAIGTIREVRALRSDGSQFPIQISVTPIDPDTGIYGAFIRDMSEQHALRARLLDKERLAAIGTTAAVFAHEVANPLNGMYMNLQLLNRRLSKTTPDERVVKTVGRIGSEIQRLIALLEEFRGLSRRQEFRFEPVQLEDLVRECVDEQQPVHRSANIDFEAQISQPVARVELDRSKFKQALLNLWKNAVEAMPDGGALTVRLYEQDGVVRLELADTGSGIPSDINVFEPFATTKEGGTGLGLPVVRQVIEAHNGSITYESQPGRGTTFAIEFPVAGAAGPITLGR